MHGGRTAVKAPRSVAASPKQLAGLSFAAVVSAELQRARETAEILATQLGLGDVVPDSDLNERAAGE